MKFWTLGSNLVSFIYLFCRDHRDHRRDRDRDRDRRDRDHDQDRRDHDHDRDHRSSKGSSSRYFERDEKQDLHSGYNAEDKDL